MLPNVKDDTVARVDVICKMDTKVTNFFVKWTYCDDRHE